MTSKPIIVESIRNSNSLQYFLEETMSLNGKDIETVCHLVSLEVTFLY